MMWMCLLLLAVVRHGNAAVGDKPDCNGLKCPAFMLDSRNADYDERTYGEITWVGTKFISYASPNSVQFWKDRLVAIKKMYRYAEGANDQNLTMTRQKPTLTTVCDNLGGPDSCNAEHFVDTYLPPDEPHPQPTETGVYLYTSTNATYFVRGWRGVWADRIQDHQDSLQALKDALQRDGKSYDDNYHKYATYIIKTDNGYEEDWLIKV